MLIKLPFEGKTGSHSFASTVLKPTDLKELLGKRLLRKKQVSGLLWTDLDRTAKIEST